MYQDSVRRTDAGVRRGGAELRAVRPAAATLPPYEVAFFSRSPGRVNSASRCWRDGSHAGAAGGAALHVPDGPGRAAGTVRPDLVLAVAAAGSAGDAKMSMVVWARRWRPTDADDGPTRCRVRRAATIRYAGRRSWRARGMPAGPYAIYGQRVMFVPSDAAVAAALDIRSGVCCDGCWTRRSPFLCGPTGFAGARRPARCSRRRSGPSPTTWTRCAARPSVAHPGGEHGDRLPSICRARTCKRFLSARRRSLERWRGSGARCSR